MSFNETTSSFFPANFLLQMQTPHEDQQDNNLPTSVAPMHHLSTPGSCTNPHEYHGVANFLGKRSMSFQGLEAYEDMNRDDDLSDDCTQVGEKKRRLNMEQVKTLEKNFELGNKLEPERKMQLARALGLQPRQIAIWFQNRRARWKTKQLEKDYDVLKKQFEAVKSENDVLLAQNKKLQAEIMAIRGRETQEPINLNKETEVSSSNRSENENSNYDINVNMPRPPPVVSTTPTTTTHQNMFFFQPTRPVTQNHHSSSRSEMQCPKIEHGVNEESFCNMFSGLDDQSGFWTAWHDQQNFH